VYERTRFHRAETAENGSACVIFSSIPFIFVFLPIVLLGYHLLGAWHDRAAGAWLCVCSFVFYGYWNANFVWLLLASVIFNYVSGIVLLRYDRGVGRTRILIVGIAANLMLLFFYKYFGPAVGFLTANGLGEWSVATVALPLGISFFTFTQIAFLVDTADGTAHERSWLNYVLFVTFFPHLIAGPILHHREIMPQFAERQTYRLSGENMAVGCSMFILGLFKKSAIADQIGDYVPLAFDHAHSVDLVAAWTGVLAYAVQLYFDFSGYSDMAIGLARMFGVRFPINFNSPYQADNIVDYWQRWHMTLTRWLTSYIYQPIVQRIMRRRYARGEDLSPKGLQAPSAFLSMAVFPLMVTMGFAGIWHGAGLQFLCFGLLHGVYLSVHRAWRTFGRHSTRVPAPPGRLPSLLVHPWSVLLTFACVLVGQVFFRADSVQGALQVLAGMIGLHAIVLPANLLAVLGGVGKEIVSSGIVTPDYAPNPFGPFLPILAALGIAFLCPNTQQIMALVPARPRVGAASPVLWAPNMRWAVTMGVMFFISLLLINNEQKFLYFQF